MLKEQGKNACNMKQRASMFTLQYSLCKPSEKLLEANHESDCKNKESVIEHPFKQRSSFGLPTAL